MKKSIFLAIFSGFLLLLSFPRYNFWILAWIGFLPLFFTLHNKSKFKAFLLSYLTGIIFWFGAIYWLAHVTTAGLFTLVLYLALYFGIFGLLFTIFAREKGIFGLIIIPAWWVILEYLRSHLLTGFPWVLLGYSQYLNLPVIQIADINGAWGVSFLVMMVNLAIYSGIACLPPACWKGGDRQGFRVTGNRKSRNFIILTVFCLFFVLAYGYFKLHLAPHALHSNTIKISVVQGNIPQELKWRSDAKDFILGEYFDLSRKALTDLPDFIVWPEASLPVILEEEPQYFLKVSDFVRDNSTPLLLGAVTRAGGFYYNDALLISNQGKLFNKYSKIHLVPFGEYIPLRGALPFLETVVPIGDFTAGRDYTLFDVQKSSGETKSKFGVLICFEDLFPGLSREFVKKGADFLINITNLAWFGRTSSPYQHLCASVFRAVENRVPVVHSANIGVSGFIAPSGRIISTVQNPEGEEIFVKGYKTQELDIAPRKLTFYNTYGEIFILLLFIIAIYSILRLIRIYIR